MIGRDALDETDEQRDRLAVMLTAVAASIETAWHTAWTALRLEWVTAVDDAILAHSLDTPAGAVRIDREPRVQAALDHTSTRLERLSATSRAATTQAVQDFTRAAVTDTRRAATAQLPPNRVVPWVDPDRTTLDRIIKRTCEQITALHYPLADDATKRVKAQLVRGIVVGSNPRTAAARMVRGIEAEFNGGRNRALVIARTELLDAHRSTARATRTANSDVLDGWVWVCRLDKRSCGACVGMHGTRHAADAPGPLGHQQCRCTAVPVTKPWRALGFDLDEPDDLIPDAAAWFASLSRREQDDLVGPVVADLLRSDRITLRDLATRKTTPGWRDSYVRTPTSTLARKASA